MNTMNEHFDKLSPTYSELRMTDDGLIAYIQKYFREQEKVLGLDVGCGSGRYDLLLLQSMPNLYLICGDKNRAMLNEAQRFLEKNGQQNFSVQYIDALNLQLPDNHFDFVLTCNAIHHFKPLPFLEQAGKTLKDNGYVFVYTRLRSQNGRNIWGRFFPNFMNKESRLYSLADIEEWMESLYSLALEDIHFFGFPRAVSLSQLIRQAEGKHYSTFSFYTKDEFQEGIEIFTQKLRQHFPNPEKIEWTDENVMLKFQKK